MVSPKKAIQYRFPTLRLVSDLALFGENRFYTNSSLLALFKMCLSCSHTTTSEIRSPVRPPNSALSNTGPNTFSSVKNVTFLAINQGKIRNLNNSCPSKMLQWDLKIPLKFDKAVGLCAFQQRSPTSYAPKRKWIHSEFTAKRFFFLFCLCFLLVCFDLTLKEPPGIIYASGAVIAQLIHSDNRKSP